MKIDIAERLRPFSHRPGVSCPIPGTLWHFQAFPTLFRWIHGLERIELSLSLTGPVADFTVELDLEKGAIWVFGRAKEGYFRFRINANDAGFDVALEKGPLAGISSSKGVLNPKARVHFPVDLSFFLPHSIERLSLGSHKAQDWDLVTRRSDLKEILPPLLLLAQKIPPVSSANIQTGLPDKKPAKNEIEPLLKAVYKEGFRDLLVPRFIDDQHQGIGLLSAPSSTDPAALLSNASRWIRSLFFQQNERRLSLLPHLPSSFDAGRFIGIACPGIGELSFEWSKSLLRRAVLRADTSGEVIFDLQKPCSTFRVRCSEKERGGRQNGKDPLRVEKGKIYLLDKFEI